MNPFSFQDPKSIGQAVVFYIAHFAVVVLLGGFVAILVAHNYASGVKAGGIVAAVYCAIICVVVVARRGIRLEFALFVVIVVPLALATGAAGGLLIPSFLTTRGTKVA